LSIDLEERILKLERSAAHWRIFALGLSAAGLICLVGGGTKVPDDLHAQKLGIAQAETIILTGVDGNSRAILNGDGIRFFDKNGVTSIVLANEASRMLMFYDESGAARLTAGIHRGDPSLGVTSKSGKQAGILSAGDNSASCAMQNKDNKIRAVIEIRDDDGLVGIRDTKGVTRQLR
jgi:hypothetical protein